MVVTASIRRSEPGVETQVGAICLPPQCFASRQVTWFQWLVCLMWYSHSLVLNDNYIGSLKNLWVQGLQVIWGRPLRKRRGCNPLPPSPVFRADNKGSQVIISWERVKSGGNRGLRVVTVQVIPSEYRWCQVNTGDVKWIQVMPSKYRWYQVNTGDAK